MEGQDKQQGLKLQLDATKINYEELKQKMEKNEKMADAAADKSKDVKKLEDEIENL